MCESGAVMEQSSGACHRDRPIGRLDKSWREKFALSAGQSPPRLTDYGVIPRTTAGKIRKTKLRGMFSDYRLPG